jgi:hypothetical protein
MAHAYAFELSSQLALPAADLWRHASSMAGVNRELWPLVRMTYPKRFASLDSGSPPLGRRAFRSWILLFGLVPIDYDDLTLVWIDPPHGFRERSPMLSVREWNHERLIAPSGSGCAITDRVSFVPRVAGLGPLLSMVFALAFRLRHRNLRRMFGGRR